MENWIMELNTIFGLSEQALKVSAKRADVLANNLVNVSTPNFKARDLDFKNALANINSTDGTILKTSNPQHLPANQDSFESSLRYRNPMQPAVDGNTVDPDVERVKFMENAMHYQVSLSFVNSASQQLKKAIVGE
jgi:flagellar basal-body rod protein FlgB